MGTSFPWVLSLSPEVGRPVMSESSRTCTACGTPLADGLTTCTGCGLVVGPNSMLPMEKHPVAEEAGMIAGRLGRGLVNGARAFGRSARAGFRGRRTNSPPPRVSAQTPVERSSSSAPRRASADPKGSKSGRTKGTPFKHAGKKGAPSPRGSKTSHRASSKR
jgi:hypothetical protein